MSVLVVAHIYNNLRLGSSQAFWSLYVDIPNSLFQDIVAARDDDVFDQMGIDTTLAIAQDVYAFRTRGHEVWLFFVEERDIEAQSFEDD